MSGSESRGVRLLQNVGNEYGIEVVIEVKAHNRTLHLDLSDGHAYTQLEVREVDGRGELLHVSLPMAEHPDPCVPADSVNHVFGI